MGGFGIVLKGLQKLNPTSKEIVTFAIKTPHLNTMKSQEYYKYALELLSHEYDILIKYTNKI